MTAASARGTASAIAQWSLLATLAGIVSLLGLMFVLMLIVGPSGSYSGGRFSMALTATMFLAAFAVPVVVIVGVPIVAALIGLWVALARRHMVADASRRSLAIGALVGGIVAPVLFWMLNGTDDAAEWSAIGTSLVIWAAAALGLFAPRLMAVSLPPGRFAAMKTIESGAKPRL